MPEQEDRLVRCFASVFPTLTPDEVRTASTESVASWDSLGAVTLAAVVEQEFGMEINLLDLPELTSFEGFRTYLDRQRGAGAGKDVNKNP